jgi:archaetidylinositol phosphate synthase
MAEVVISHNTWVHRITRVAVRPLVNTPVTPNHLTTLRLVTAVGAACAFAVDSFEARMIGVAVMVVSLMLDRADGELARQSGKTSQLGHRYDLIADGLSNGVIFIGIGVGLTNSVLGHWAIVLGLFTGTAAFVSELLLMRLDTLKLQSTAQLGGRWGFDPDDAMFLVPVAVAFGFALQLMYAAFVGTMIVAMVFLILLWRRSGSGVAAEDR